MTDDDGKPVMPEDPITVMREAIGGIRELFVSMVETGFTEWQACRVIGVMMAENGRQS